MKNRENNKKPIIILTGPTSVGKTALSIALAKRVGGEVISADSMQVYRKMDIGTAKISEQEMDDIPHHLIDILEPDEEFHVAMFQRLAKEAMSGIYERGKIPIIVGGTGFYIQALLYDIDFKETESHEHREKLERIARERGSTYLHNLLKEIDEESATEIHENNVKRVIRAIEYYYETGEKISKHNKKEREKSSPYLFDYFVLNDKREHIYKRIDQRVDQMMEAGLLQEVQQLIEQGYSREFVSMQGLGYKEFFDYFAGEISVEEAVYILKRDTRHFAKRQLTWFKRERDVIWVGKDEFQYDENQILEFMIDKLKESELIR